MITSAVLRWRHSWLRPRSRPSGGGGPAGSPSSHCSTSKWNHCFVHIIPAKAWRTIIAASSSRSAEQRGVELVGLGARAVQRRVEARVEVARVGREAQPDLGRSAPGATVRVYQSAPLVPVSGLTVAAPETTWSPMPSFG